MVALGQACGWNYHLLYKLIQWMKNLSTAKCIKNLRCNMKKKIAGKECKQVLHRSKSLTNGFTETDGKIGKRPASGLEAQASARYTRNLELATLWQSSDRISLFLEISKVQLISL